MSLPILYTVALFAALALALQVGSREAQLAASGSVLAQVAAVAVHPGQWDAAQLGAFTVDLILLGWLSWIIIRTTLTWPIALGVLQTLTVLGHLARLSVRDMETMGYYVLLQWTAWPAALTIVIGTLLDKHAGRTSSASWRRLGSSDP